MAETNISADKTTGQVVEAEHVNELKNAIVTIFSGRDSSGTLAANQQLGSATYPWGLAYINSLIVNGSLIDFTTLAVESNIIQSGKTRATSELPDFIRATGSTNSATIEGATTSLIAVISGVTTTVNTDIVISSLTTASSGAASECLVNDTTLTDQLFTKYLGDSGTSITVDTMGANITARIGEYVCLKGATEYMLAYVESATKLTNIKRGFFLDSSGSPVVRETLANNDTLSLMSLGWVFVENNGTTVDVTYNAPIYDYAQPSGPATGDYWFDLQNKEWRRYNGADFIVINRILIGAVVIDTANCVASRSIDFDLGYEEVNSITFDEVPFSTEIVKSATNNNMISVNGNILEQNISKIEYNITTDLDSGVSETSNTTYYLYVSQVGQNIISDEKPYSYSPKLKGHYHPYQTWRCVASFFNDSGSNIELVQDNPFLTSQQKKKGDVVQKVSFKTGALATGTGLFPVDNTVPQNTEGDEYMTSSISPINPLNELKIDIVLIGEHSTLSRNLVALFQDSIPDSLAVAPNFENTGGGMGTTAFSHSMTAGTTDKIIFKVRAGGSVAGTFTFNGAGGAAQYGGVCSSSIIITEIQS